MARRIPRKPTKHNPTDLLKPKRLHCHPECSEGSPCGEGVPTPRGGQPQGQSLQDAYNRNRMQNPKKALNFNKT